MGQAGFARPDPDQLLAQIQADEQQQRRGRLTLFLGYAAGVGKTYSMLEAAHQRKAEGLDVVVGLVETHGRAETGALVDLLEVIPRRTLLYRQIELTEMDVDAVLARHPQVVLVDELAHTNVPGSRHIKRYQDVEELLQAGIDVYTTLNIQHLESLNDVVAQITGVTVRETVPDRIVDEVSEIALIDLPPDELLQRLREGKVYVPEQAARAVQKFFRKGNLTALRELTLRRAAVRVDNQMLDYMAVESIPGPWPAAERLLVCISPSPLAARLVRSARRLADELNANWTTVFVQTPEYSRLSLKKRDRVSQTLLLAEELGSKTLTLTGEPVAETIMAYARTHNVTKVIAGKPLRARWKDWIYGSLTDQLIRASGNIDVYVISGEPEPPAAPEMETWRPHRPFARYLTGLALVCVTAFLGAMLKTYLTPANLVMFFLLDVVIASYYLGRGPSILVSLVSVLAFDFFLVPPVLTFAVSDTQYLITFTGLLVVGLVISQLSAAVHERAEAAQQREAATAALYALSRDLSAAGGLDSILNSVLEHAGETFGREVVVFLPDRERDGLLEPYPPHPDSLLDEKELAVAAWAYQHGQPAGRCTNTLAAAEGHYLPLKTGQGTVGVLRIKPQEPRRGLEPEKRRLLEAFANQAALAIERARLVEQARQAQNSQETELLQKARPG